MIESSDNAARKSSNHRFQKDNGKRILVVDDEYDISLTIKVILEENGFKVDSFNDASQPLGFHCQA
jgi:FixJ family two-component response regulator